MPGKTRPYDQFGPYVLFKKLETDALSDLWRAARIDDRHLGPLVALRKFHGGDRDALARAAADAHEVAPLLDGTSFVKGQIIDVLDGVPFVAYEYAGGRSLRHIVDRARGGAGIAPNPIPLDQVILIAERVALSLETTAALRYGGNRLAHGGLLPHFVWITDDGEVRVAGQRLGAGLVASLKDGKVGPLIGRYLSPEYQHSGEPTKPSEVFSLGAVLFLMVTGHEPPEASHVSAFGQTIRAVKTMAGPPVPDDIRAILDKSLAIDPARRFESVADMRQALAALSQGGKYAPTTFNLAFYLSSLLKKEMEGESIDRDKESKINIAPYLEALVAAPLPPAAPSAPAPRKRPVLAIAAVAALAVIGAGAWFVMTGSAAKSAARQTVASHPVAPPPKKIVAPPPVVVAVAAPAPAAATASADPAAQKKAFEDAVNAKLQDEMAKLQSQFNRELQQKTKPQERQPVLTASIAPQHAPEVADDRGPSAAAIDERRIAMREERAASAQPPASAPAQAQVQPQVQAQPQPQTQPVQMIPPTETQPAAAPPLVQKPVVHAGDLIEFNELDIRPEPMSAPRLVYPPIARREHAEASLILTILISETGQVMDVKVLRGDPRFGFEAEAIRALRTLRFHPAMKDGKAVRTWMPQPIRFKAE